MGLQVTIALPVAGKPDASFSAFHQCCWLGDFPRASCASSVSVTRFRAGAVSREEGGDTKETSMSKAKLHCAKTTTGKRKQKKGQEGEKPLQCALKVTALASKQRGQLVRRANTQKQVTNKRVLVSAAFNSSAGVDVQTRSTASCQKTLFDQHIHAILDFGSRRGENRL